MWQRRQPAQLEQMGLDAESVIDGESEDRSYDEVICAKMR